MSKPEVANTSVELREEFEKLELEWSQAIVSNDAEAIGRFMADDWLIVGQSGITDKNSFLALVASGDLTHEMMEGDVKRVIPSTTLLLSLPVASTMVTTKDRSLLPTNGSPTYSKGATVVGSVLSHI